MINTTPLQPFSDEVIAFFNDLSKKLMGMKEFSDVATFGFWIRKASLLKEKEKYDDIDVRIGKGLTFHIAPSNVAVNFAFSLAAGLLSGNANIVRLPSKEFVQTDIIIAAINDLINDTHKNMESYICLIKYPVQKEISDYFSSLCDVRMVWGGDVTIANLRKSSLKPRASEITFADRYSVAIINADAYLSEENKVKVAENYYNDTYLNDQNACTAPRAVFWMGENKEEAKKLFWENMQMMIRENYQMSAVQAVGKQAAFYKAAAFIDVNYLKTDDNYLMRIGIENVPENLMDFKYNSGFFFEKDIDALEEILPLCSEKFQTLTYFGFTKEQIVQFMKRNRPRGIDRAMPMGSSMDFNLIWDGHDLIRELSRKVTII